jgi:hypothetical protein
MKILMKAPENCDSCSVNGVSYKTNKKGLVLVSKAASLTLRDFGWTVVVGEESEADGYSVEGSEVEDAGQVDVDQVLQLKAETLQLANDQLVEENKTQAAVIGDLRLEIESLTTQLQVSETRKNELHAMNISQINEIETLKGNINSKPAAKK